MSPVEALDDAMFPGALAPFRRTLCWDPTQSAPVLDGALLLDALGRFQRSVAGAWQPACSLWGQIYFNTLLIPATCILAHEAEPMPCVAAIGVSLCPVSGTPRRCALQTCKADRPGSGFAEALANHVASLIDDLGAASRLSKRLFRESADRTIDWTLIEIGCADPARARTARLRLSAHGWRAFGPGGGRTSMPVRRFCCLRDRLPGIASCGDACPRGRAHARLATPGRGSA